MQKVLVKPSVAQLARSDGMACSQRGIVVVEVESNERVL